jgi:hypothetical protein
MTDTRACTCDVPSQANYHTSVVVDNNGLSTDGFDLYRCSEHVREFEPGDQYWVFDMFPAGFLVPGCYVVESTTTHLRGEV